jgi:hypothetical protein
MTLVDGLRHAGSLVLEQYAPDKYAWLTPETINDPEPDDALYTITESGRDYLRQLRASRWLFGARS